MTERLTLKQFKELKRELKNKYDLNDGYFKRFELLNSSNKQLMYKELIFLKIFYDTNEKMLMKALINKYINIQFYKRKYLTDFIDMDKFYDIYKYYEILKDEKDD